MSDNASVLGKKAKLEYQRNWRKQNREKIKNYQERYWERKAIREQLQQEEIRKDGRSNQEI